jgi:hypothetical protein
LRQKEPAKSAGFFYGAGRLQLGENRHRNLNPQRSQRYPAQQERISSLSDIVVRQINDALLKIARH